MKWVHLKYRAYNFSAIIVVKQMKLLPYTLQKFTNLIQDQVHSVLSYPNRGLALKPRLDCSPTVCMVFTYSQRARRA
jgi:hypothetical protein